MKKQFIAWLPKSISKQKCPIQHFSKFNQFSLFRTKGGKSDWPEEDWPPVKVRITVETVDYKGSC